MCIQLFRIYTFGKCAYSFRHHRFESLLEGLQQSHGWWPILCSMGFYKIYRSSVLLLQPYWNALLTQHILDIFCCVKWWKSFWYSFQWARWVSTVPWVMSYQPSMGCHKINRPEMTYWTAGNVVATKLYAHAEESYPHEWWVEKTDWARISHHPWDCWSPSSPLEWV